MRTEPRPARHFLTFALLGCYLVGMHLRLSLYSETGSMLVPMYLMLVPAAVLVLIHREQLSRKIGTLLVALLVYLTVHPFVTFVPYINYADSLLSSAQLLAAIVSALAVVYACSRLERLRLRRFFLVAWCGLMTLAVLEMTSLRPLFDEIRNSLYLATGRGIYLNVDRDIVLYGRMRPSALASEPSFLADSHMCLAVLVFLLDRDRGRPSSWLKLALMVAAGFAVAPSAKVGFYLLAAAVWVFWPKSARSRIGLVIFIALTGYALLRLYENVVYPVVSRLDITETGSFFGRISAGPLVGFGALGQHPLMGHGVGNSDGLYAVIEEVWLAAGAFQRYPWFQGQEAANLMSNGFWWQWVYLGVLGGFIFTLLISRLLSALGVEHSFRTIVCAWIVWYSGFAFIDPASWFVVAVFAIPAMADGRSVARPPILDAGDASETGDVLHGAEADTAASR